MKYSNLNLLTGINFDLRSIECIESCLERYIGKTGKVSAAIGDSEKTFSSLTTAFEQTSRDRATCLYFWNWGSIRMVCEPRSELRRIPWLSHVLHVDNLGRKPTIVIDECFETLIREMNPYFGQLRSDGKVVETISYGLPRIGERLYLAHDIERQIPGLISVLGKGKCLANGMIFDKDVDVERAIGEKYFVKPNQPANVIVSKGLFGFLDFFKDQLVSKVTTPVVFEIDRSGCAR